MESTLAASLTALWLGIMTSISPCPLATNIAAVSFIGRRVDSPRYALWTSAGYLLGRLIAYIAVGIIVTAGLLSIPGIANFLQKYSLYLVGPILILTGVVLIDLLPLRLPSFAPGARLEAATSRGGLWSASLLGAFFALSFCPVSAALFFGSLVPLAVKHHSYFLLPTLYGIGTGLPVILFGIAIALGARTVSRLFTQITRFELWVRRGAGVVFILIGLYCIATDLLGWL